MTEDRAIEIISALGADAARWPEAERSAVQALRHHPKVAAALAEAAQLDALLTDWARADVGTAGFDSALLAPPVGVAVAGVVAMPSRVRRRWLAAGALAAAVAGALVLTPMGGVAPGAGPASDIMAAPSPVLTAEVAPTFPDPPVLSAAGASENGDDAEFAYVFTPTVDEDSLI